MFNIDDWIASIHFMSPFSVACYLMINCSNSLGSFLQLDTLRLDELIFKTRLFFQRLLFSWHVFVESTCGSICVHHHSSCLGDTGLGCFGLWMPLEFVIRCGLAVWLADGIYLNISYDLNLTKLTSISYGMLFQILYNIFVSLSYIWLNFSWWF